MWYLKITPVGFLGACRGQVLPAGAFFFWKKHPPDLGERVVAKYYPQGLFFLEKTPLQDFGSVWTCILGVSLTVGAKLGRLIASWDHTLGFSLPVGAALGRLIVSWDRMAGPVAAERPTQLS